MKSEEEIRRNRQHIYNIRSWSRDKVRRNELANAIVAYNWVLDEEGKFAHGELDYEV